MTQAYFQLIRVTWSANGSRSVSLGKYGSYEVHLVERRPADGSDAPHLWVELHAKGAEKPVEARGCDDLEAAAIAAEQIMLKAERLRNEILSKRDPNDSGNTGSGE